MKSTDIQDNKERLVFTEFTKIFKIPGTLIPKEINQKPDVIIKQGNIKLGIEITELADKIQPIYGSQRKFALELEKYLDHILLSCIEVHIFFADNINIPASKKKNYAEVVGKEIAIRAKDFKESLDEIQIIEIENIDFGIGIFSIKMISMYVNKISIYPNNIVLLPSSEWIKYSFISELKQRIESKNLLYHKYLEIVDECWLLIYTHTFMPEGQYFFSKEMATICFYSLFSKTLFYEYGNGIYYEIN